MIEQYENMQNWSLTYEHFLNKDEVKRLRNYVEKRRNRDKTKKTETNDWFMIECLLNTGLRVAELADLRCGDIALRDELSCVHVRNGKGGKSREVLISKRFQNVAHEYLDWKEIRCEQIGQDDILMYSSRSKENIQHEHYNLVLSVV